MCRIACNLRKANIFAIVHYPRDNEEYDAKLLICSKKIAFNLQKRR